MNAVSAVAATDLAISRRSAVVVVATALVQSSYAPAAVLLAAAPFRFDRFLAFGEGPFRVFSAEGTRLGRRRIGSGEMLSLGQERLEWRLELSHAGQRLEATARLRLLRRDGSSYRIALSYRGREAGRNIATDEEVLADAFLADEGILTFPYLSGERFFQLSRRGNETSFVSDWGRAILLPGR